MTPLGGRDCRRCLPALTAHSVSSCDHSRIYLAAQKLRSSAWGNLVHSALLDGSMPKLDSWETVRRFIALAPGPAARQLEHARSMWSAYMALNRKCERGARTG